MGIALEDAVRIIAEAAGWKIAAPDEHGARHYLLEEGLDLDIESPDGRVLVASADLGDAPEAGSPGADEEWVRIGKLAAGVMKRRASVLAANEGRLELFRTVDLSQAGVTELVDAVRDFLNDEAWWRANLSAVPGQAASPFSMSGMGPAGWFPGELSFGGGMIAP